MSWWTDFRDGLETAAAIVVNYWLPGAGALGYYINSKGSQEQLRSPLGMIGMLGAGTVGGLAGNAANYGALLGSSGEGAISAAPVTTAADDSLQGQLAAMSSQGAGTTGEGLGAGGSIDYGAFNKAPGTAGETAGYGSAADVGGTGVSSQSFASGGGAPNVSGTSTLSGVFGNTGNVSKAAGAMPWSSPGGVANLASSALGLIGSGYMNQQAALAAKRADPFGPQRQYYADAMGRLAQNPNSIYTMPGYRAGEDAVKRAMAAQGYSGSGNVLAALQKYGGDFYNQTLANYGQLAGAGFNPAAAAQLGLGGNQYALELAGRSLGTLGYQSRMAGNQWPWGG